MNDVIGSSNSAEGRVPSRPDNYTKRAYQDELVARAVESNIVCALGTGTGKTYIAVKLIQEFQDEVKVKWEEGGKRTIFVVPSVPLVEQQFRVLEKYTGLKTGAYHGAAGVDEWTAQKWTEQFEKNQILVMVHDIFKMLLSQAILEPQRLNLIILDECHHAAEKHPYREIMRILHANKHPHKPRILGLTASVINIKLEKKASPYSQPKSVQLGTTQEKLEAKIKQLEDCMGCVVWTSLDDSLEVHGKRAAPVVDCYEAMAMTEEMDDLREGLVNMIEWLILATTRTKRYRHVADDDDEGDLDEVCVIASDPSPMSASVGTASSSTLKEIKCHLGQVLNTLTSLGPWCAYKTSGLLLKDLMLMRSLGCFLRETIYPVHASISTLHVMGCQLEVDFGVRAVTTDSSEGIWRLISPKARRLIELLDQFSSNGQRKDFCCIVFVKERYNAWALHTLLQLIGNSKSSTRHSYISSGFCVGQLTESGSEESSGERPHLSLKQLRSTLDLFRQGVINVLVSTDVVEEGFDVRECNLIIRFDPPQTYRSYVQSRGRARAEHSHFIMMLESGRPAAAFKSKELREFQELDLVMKNHCYDRISPTVEERIKGFADEEYPPFQPSGCNALISMDTALPTLQRYCNTLPNDNMTSCLTYMDEQKLGNKRFICTAYLPRSADIRDPITSKVMESQTSAKKLAALFCCKGLFEAGQLDPVNLLPWPKEYWIKEAKDFTGNHQPKDHPKAGTKKRVQLYQKKIAPCFAPVPYTKDASRFLYEIKLTWTGKIHDDFDGRFEYDEGVVVGLVTRDFLPPVPAFPIYIGMREYTVHFQFVNVVELEEAEVDQVRAFHNVVFQDVLQLEGLLSLDKSQYDTLFVVALINSQIDWQTMREVGQRDRFVVKERTDKVRRKASVQADKYQDKVVVTSYQEQVFRQYVMQVRQDLTPSTPQNEENGDLALTHGQHIMVVYGIELQHSHQPMLALRYCSKGLNFLHPKPRDSKEEKRTEGKAKPGFTDQGYMLVAAELCQVLPVTSALYFKLRLLPSILHRLDSFVNVFSLYQRLRRETGIGQNVPLPQGWRDFEHAVQHQNIYHAPYDQPINNQHSVKRLALDPNPAIANLNRPPTPPQESRENVVPVTQRREGFFYSDYLQKKYYMAQEKKKKYRDLSQSVCHNVINHRWPEFLPVVNQPFLVVSPGCHLRLVEPPFTLDAEFLVNPACQPLPELSDLLTALTLKGAGDSVNLERLETMGDAFLKMATCLYLFVKYQAFHEGKLSLLKSHQISNHNLYRLAKEKGLCNVILGQVLDPAFMFLPPGFATANKEKVAVATVAECNNSDVQKAVSALDELGEKLALRSDGSVSVNDRNGSNMDRGDFDGRNDLNEVDSADPRVVQSISDKSLADVMEALIGVVLIKCGSASAMHFMDWLGLKVLPESGVQFGSRNVASVPSPLLRDDPEVGANLRKLQRSFEDFEERIGYKFRQPAFLLEAFTHNSFFSNRLTNCYQRLEFIGDAILDFLITRYLYEVKPINGKELDPGQLSDLRQALVNNKTFSLLAARFNFHSSMKYYSPKIFSQIRMYVEEAQKNDPTVVGLSDDMLDMDPNDDDEENEGYDGYEEAEDPKTLGDVFESVAGAIFLDSGFSLDAVWKVYWNMMQERIDFCIKHCPKNPVRVLGEEYPTAVDYSKPVILSNQKVQVRVSVRKAGEEPTFTGAGSNHRIAKCSAAKEALMKLVNYSQNLNKTQPFLSK